MKRKRAAPGVPEPTRQEVDGSLRKSKTIQVRVTALEKAEIVACARKVRLTQTDYLMRCHGVVARRILDEE